MIPNYLTGLEYLKQRVSGVMPDPPIFETMAMQITHVEKGFVRVAAKPDRSHLNSAGTVQGGVTASILDAATGFAVHSLLDAGLYVVTVGLELHFLRPVFADNGNLTAEGRIVQLSRLIGVANGTLRDAAGSKIAAATGTCVIRRLKKTNLDEQRCHLSFIENRKRII
jgi:uncharacterized protein (TIGR00369 family)